ncbi:hypothetical protein EYF80_025529 [Liparis tanakae]|uniref:Uncharacterized protein n=1 Tax=Liparis tanakae TaxID=230148 RepID=A0A4Z2HEH6_9TELE|nr:hypothetical protein EYF80_025529 [Liparis tanakae]
MGVKGEIRGRGKEKASCVRRKGSRQQSKGDEDVEEETGGPRGGIKEAIDQSVRRTPPALSPASLVYSHHQHGMDFLAQAPLHLHECDQNEWLDQRGGGGRGGGGVGV